MEVIIFACRGRDAAHERLFASLEASDIGKNYTVMMHPEGMHRNEHWRLTHEHAANAKGEFVIVLEDDVIVNRHILKNVETWGWKEHKDFGAGWIYNPGGYSNRDTWYKGPRAWAMTPGVVYRTKDLPRIIEVAWQQMSTVSPAQAARPGVPAIPASAMPWDCAVAYAAHDGGKRIRVHYPSLVEHPNDLPSALGNPSESMLRTSRGTFDPDWERPRGHEHGYIDRFGRRQVLR